MSQTIIWSPGVTLAAIEKQVILRAYSHFRSHQENTASALGISVRALYNKLKQYDEDAVKEKEAEDARIARTQDYLNRSRIGNVAANLQRDAAVLQTNKQPLPKAEAGISNESTTSVSKEQSVSVPVGTKVQEMPPTPASRSGQQRRSQ